jgi:hypothetical protein
MTAYRQTPIAAESCGTSWHLSFDARFICRVGGIPGSQWIFCGRTPRATENIHPVTGFDRQ